MTVIEVLRLAVAWAKARRAMLQSPPDDPDRRRKLNDLAEAESKLYHATLDEAPASGP